MDGYALNSPNVFICRRNDFRRKGKRSVLYYTKYKIRNHSKYICKTVSIADTQPYICCAVLLYELFVFGLSTGWCDVTAGIQSIAAYMESNLSVSILEYIVISVFTKV